MDATAGRRVAARLARHQDSSGRPCDGCWFRVIRIRRSLANGIRLGPRVKPRAASPPDQSRARIDADGLIRAVTKTGGARNAETVRGLGDNGRIPCSL